MESRSILAGMRYKARKIGGGNGSSRGKQMMMHVLLTEFLINDCDPLFLCLLYHA